MNFVANRSFLLVKPKQAFIDWINNHGEKKYSLQEIISTLKTLYMVESLDYTSPKDINNLIKKNYKKIFDHTIIMWYEYRDHFAGNMTFEIFNEWFDCEFIEICLDTLDNEVHFEEMI